MQNTPVRITFTDIDDRYTITSPDRDAITLTRNGHVLYEGPASALYKSGEYYAITVGAAIDADVDTVPSEMIGEVAAFLAGGPAAPWMHIQPGA